MSREELQAFTSGLKNRIRKPDLTAAAEAKRRLDTIAKPLDSLGIFEEQLVRLAAAEGTAKLCISPARLVIFCADHGVVEEGVSQSGHEVSALVAGSMARGRSSACRMAEAESVELRIVNVGLACDVEEEALTGRCIRKGTRNFAKESAMTQEECLTAIRCGMEEASLASEKGIRILLSGEMGIGNTCSSAALASAMLGRDAAAMCGRGAGLSDEGLERKILTIRRALKLHGFDTAVTSAEETFRLLSCVGGYEIAAISGLCIGAALEGIPLILDGVITLAAALAAVRIFPECSPWLLASHQGKEAATEGLLKALGLEAPIHAGLALGEGSGAVMGYALLRNVLSVYEEAADFSELSMEAYHRL
ncbi:MAG: nicotinate-nucleotide--dimethylbenzimidazole phosphoribosyltransferase [Lachnospiraceae bacterium]|nr:nicotinate-nucleotide--dimethylbenzimidazole phosphoribosyltransferase [Lachnospiraceae bacterium]